MSIIKIFCIDQPLRFHIKNLIISVGKQKINFVYTHFMCSLFTVSYNNTIQFRQFYVRTTLV